jgi:hypothetical protein
MLGSLLIQPQMLARMQGRSAGEDLVDEVVALAQLLAMKPQALEMVFPAFEAASAAMGQAIFQRIQARLPQALTELRQVVDPVVLAVAGFGDGDAPADAAALLQRVADGLDSLAALAGLLSDAQIRALVRRLSAIATDTLGLSQTGFRADFIAMLGAARTALRSGNAALSNDAAAVRESLACLLARLENDLYPRFPIIDLNPDRLANLLIGLLRRTPVPDVLGKAQCLLDKLKAVLQAVAGFARAAVAVTAAAGGDGTSDPAGSGAAMVSLGAAVATGAFADGEPPPATPDVGAPTGAAGPPDAAGAAAPGREADGSYCWYASWLYARRRQGFSEGNGFFSDADNQWGNAIWQTICPGYPEDEVWLSADRKQLVLRRAGNPHEVLHQQDTPFEWYQAPQFTGANVHEHFLIERIGGPFLETWARVTAVLAQVAAGFWHVVKMGLSPKEYASNISLWLQHWAEAVTRGIAEAPMASKIAQAAGKNLGFTWLFTTLIPVVVFVACSFEGVHTKTTNWLGFLQWLTLIGGDAISAYTVSAATGGIRDFFLSLFTLINYSGPDVPPPLGDDTRPKNWDMADPVIGAVTLGLGMAFQALIPRDDYGLPFDNNGSASFGAMYFPWMLLGAPLAGAFNNLIGTLAAWCICRTTTPTQLGKKVGLGALSGLFTFVIEFYSFREGGTDGGRYNPRIDPNGNPYTPARSDFAGYPDKASSPYRLPYASGDAKYVGQANLGFFSHARYNTLPQVYAYDFAHDFQDEILCVRDGTVVDFFDWIPENTNPSNAQVTTARTASDGVMGGAGWRGDSPSWNFVTLRHDTAVAAHDKDQGGAAVTTYATYGHGANGGVRTLWQSVYGKAPNQIIGTRVQRGNPLMQAGSTGVSFHNHLHLHVQGGPAAPPVPPGPPVTGPNQLVGPGAINPYTIPFVFGDAPGDGVLKNLTWYRSSNPRTTTLPP